MSTVACKAWVSLVSNLENGCWSTRYLVYLNLEKFFSDKEVVQGKDSALENKPDLLGLCSFQLMYWKAFTSGATLVNEFLPHTPCIQA